MRFETAIAPEFEVMDFALQYFPYSIQHQLNWSVRVAKSCGCRGEAIRVAITEIEECGTIGPSRIVGVTTEFLFAHAVEYCREQSTCHPDIDCVRHASPYDVTRTGLLIPGMAVVQFQRSM